MKAQVIESSTAKEEDVNTEMTAVNVELCDEPRELQLIAYSRDQMALAQTKLVGWAQRKIAEYQEQVQNASLAKTAALAGNFNTAPFQKMLTRAATMVEFYEKVEAALAAGYTIIPDLPVDVFSIRTMKSRPKPMASKWSNDTRAQTSESPPIGHGDYVDSDPLSAHTRTEYIEDSKTKDLNPQRIFAAVEFRDVIDFPMSMAKAEIMEEVDAAMQHKVFDEIGVLPNRRIQKKDPVVVGIIKDPRSSAYSKRRLMFLIAWYLDTATL